jgi:hypothetical protein
VGQSGRCILEYNLGGAARGEPARDQAARRPRRFETTEGYIREAENLRAANPGEPFPALPAPLLGSGRVLARGLAANFAKPNASTWLAERAGFEGAQSSRIGALSTAHRAVAALDTTSTSADAPLNRAPLDPVLDRSRPAPREQDPVEAALAAALEAATAACRWDVVAQLARELEARRLASAGAIDLAGERAKRRK